MAPISSVLVTGASGFIGAHVVDELLRRGIKVRGTTRSSAKANKMLLSRPKYANNLEFRIITDLATPGVFDDAIKGVDAIVHTASPVTFEATDNERELLIPAIAGTKSLLSAAKNQPTIQRIVLTSSFGSVVDPAHYDDPTVTYTGDNWNPITYEQAKEGIASDAYNGAKKYAERAAWDFIESETTHFDLVTLCPPLVFGPIVHPLSKLSELNESTALIYEVVSGADPLPDGRVTAWVDVRDLAFAHVEALLRPDASNLRFVVASSERFTYQRVADILRQEFTWAEQEVTRGNEGAPIPSRANVDGGIAATALGIRYRSFKECILEAGAQLKGLQDKERAGIAL